MKKDIAASLTRIFGAVAMIGLFCVCAAVRPSSASNSSSSDVQTQKSTTIIQRHTTTVVPGPRFHRINSPEFFGGPSNYNAVFVGGTPIMRFRVPAGGFSPHERAVATQERVNKLLSQGPIHPDDITTETRGSDAVVLVKGQLLFTADMATARFNQMTPMELADHWADNMRGVLPGLTEPK